MLVARVVGDLLKVFGGDGGPQGFAGDLHVVAQLPVVQPQAAFVVGGEENLRSAFRRTAGRLSDGRPVII